MLVKLFCNSGITTTNRCSWYKEAYFKKRRQFCEEYEGYAELCRCQQPLILKDLFQKNVSTSIIKTLMKSYYFEGIKV